LKSYKIYKFRNLVVKFTRARWWFWEQCSNL